MPQFLEEALAKGARSHGFTGRRAARYIYGGMNNLRAMHGNQETARGRAMEVKHEEDMKKPRRKKVSLTRMMRGY